jgi:predicted RNase H-like HicB family nuclease
MSHQTTREYTVVIERAIDEHGRPSNFCGYVLDMPGAVVATGATVDEVTDRLREALEMHLELLREDGRPIPEPGSYVAMRKVVVSVPAGAAANG